MAAFPLLPSLVAVIVADPVATAVTRPLPSTVAIAELLVAHVTARPLGVLPAASRVRAESSCVPPTMTLADAGVTVTDATGTIVLPLTVTIAEPSAEPGVALAKIVYWPGADGA